MTNTNPTEAKLRQELISLSEFRDKIKEAILGEEPQMRKEYIALQKRVEVRMVETKNKLDLLKKS